MTKDEALRLALEFVEANHSGGPDAFELIDIIKATLEANEFNPDWDTQAVLTEEIQRMAKRIEELEAKDEPVAWMHKETGLLRKETISSKGADWDENHWKPLYTTPPQRTWVKLTDEQFLEACQMAEAGNYMVAFQRIQQWLKENNT